jgi:hypothetical protein
VYLPPTSATCICHIYLPSVSVTCIFHVDLSRISATCTKKDLEIIFCLTGYITTVE